MKFQQFINESINDKGILKAIHMAGSPASGKSTAIKKIKSGSIEPRLVNIDTWTEYFKAYNEILWGKTKNKNEQLTQNQLINYINSLLPLWIDGTSSSPSSLYRRDGILKSLGYDTGMIWIDVSLKTALNRAKLRERPVSEKEIIRVYDKINKLKPQYKTNFKFFLEIDNEENKFNEDIIIKAFNKTNKFFNQSTQNQIGKSIKEELITKNLKYLTDLDDYSFDQLKNIISIWYK